MVGSASRDSGSSVFSSKLLCGDCGGFYGQKVWHSTDRYRKQIWRCNSKFKGTTKCETPALDMEIIKQKFMEAYNRLMPDKDIVIEGCTFIRKELTDCSEIDTELDRLNEEVKVVAEMVKACVQENAVAAQSQEDYEKRYNNLVRRYETAVAEAERLTAEKETRQHRDRELRLFIKALKSQPAVMVEWNDKPWVMLLEHATVRRDGSVAFRFKDGTETTI